MVSVTNEEDRSFLSKQYEKIFFVSTSSVLAKYLYPYKLNASRSICRPIYPFGFNLSQRIATEKAMSEQISVIEGPPGTGKTQTIFNIIANALINNKTVAVVSNNNAVTSNVLEKIEKYDIDFIAAYLGKKEKKEKFFNEQRQDYPDMTTWMIDVAGFERIRKTLEVNGKELDES